MSRLFFGLFASMFFALAGATAAPLEHLQSARADDYFKVESETIGRPFHIYVRLPGGYAEGDAEYPVIYLLDGGTNFPMLAPYYFLLSFDEPAPEAIIVGISYGGNSFEEGNFRGTDYTAPSPEREFWGGAEQYQTFLETELLPMIEEKFRADKSRRVLFGQSLAGQFVIYSALTNPDLFWGRIASNPAFHRNLDYFLNLKPAEPKKEPRVFVAGATLDDERFLTPRTALLAQWEQSPPPWDFAVGVLEGERHASAAPLAFRAGMRWLFQDATE